jgi:hypothetical protein
LLIVRRSKLYYRASGIITPIGVVGTEFIGNEILLRAVPLPPQPVFTKFSTNSLSRSVKQIQKMGDKGRVISFHKTRMNISLSTKMGYFAVSLAFNS